MGPPVEQPLAVKSTPSLREKPVAAGLALEGRDSQHTDKTFDESAAGCPQDVGLFAFRAPQRDHKPVFLRPLCLLTRPLAATSRSIYPRSAEKASTIAILV